MEFTYQPGQTPLDPDEKEGLKPKHISTQGELNEWEQLNIIKGARWASASSSRIFWMSWQHDFTTSLCSSTRFRTAMGDAAV